MLYYLANIHKICFPNKPWSEQDFEDILANESNFLIQNNNKAFLIVQFLEGKADIITICVLPEHRKKGIAKKLTSGFIEKYKPTKITLEVNENNLAAIKLYKSLGFKKTSTRKNYYNSDEDGILMVLDIT